jgi:hypothetical protein
MTPETETFDDTHDEDAFDATDAGPEAEPEAEAEPVDVLHVSSGEGVPLVDVTPSETVAAG